MTNPTDSVKLSMADITQADCDAAADLIEAYFQGNTTLRQLAEDFRSGHKSGPWPATFAAHRLRSTDDLLEALEGLKPWVEEWAEISDYPPGKAKMKIAIRNAESAIARHRGTV